ncbi:hypothetical protein OSC03_11265 [Morganella morganii]|uniref:hypothetical protein n=1 Tax=Morganella morganii TaxID=582 RepID=UPI002874DC0C|nr:hypothetical protein [Morganella morganii]MDS0907601.1 hypothetical protein [Morganella morganii]
MKVNHFVTSLILVIAILGSTPFLASAAITKNQLPDGAERQFAFIENNTDNNYFVTPLGPRDPRMGGANRWTGLKYQGSGTIYQQSLGYIDNGRNTGLAAGRRFDMWLENTPIRNPLLGLRCINWYSGCNIETSLIPPQATDSKGFYGAVVTSGGAKWMHGMMADPFYEYLKGMAVGDMLNMEINTCQTAAQYDATRGERCIDQKTGKWNAAVMHHRKGAHISLHNTNSLSEVFINSDGIPLIGEGNSDCKVMTIGRKNGLACKMVNYTLQTSMSNLTIRIFPAINNTALASAISADDMQFSLNGSNWKYVRNNSYYYTFNDLKSANSVYIFMSSNFFKQMVKLGIADSNTRDLFNIRFQNTESPESGWYEFSTSTALIIKPRDFGVSIISKEYELHPHREGKVEHMAPPLDFEYIVTTSGRTKADQVLINVTGPSQSLGGKSYCIFSSPDKSVNVPFPGYLSFITQSGKQVKDAGCNGTWYDMTDALWTATPWTDISGDPGFLNKTTVMFSIPMDNKISERTVENNGWFGEVSASGEIHVQATWRNVK